MSRRKPGPGLPSADPQTTSFDESFGALHAALPLGSPVPDLSAQRSALTTLGGQFGPFATAAATAIQKGGALYANLPPTAHELPAQAQKLRLLEHAHEKVRGLLGAIAGEMAATRVAIAGGVRLVEDTTSAVLQNPTTSAPLRRQAEAASTDLRGLRTSASGRRKASRQRTRSLKTGFVGTQAQTLDRLSAVEGELQQARLQIQYLSGERLRPADLGAPGAAAPPAAKASRRRQAR